MSLLSRASVGCGLRSSGGVLDTGQLRPARRFQSTPPGTRCRPTAGKRCLGWWSCCPGAPGRFLPKKCRPLCMASRVPCRSQQWCSLQGDEPFSQTPRRSWGPRGGVLKRMPWDDVTRRQSFMLKADAGMNCLRQMDEQPATPGWSPCSVQAGVRPGVTGTQRQEAGTTWCKWRVDSEFNEPLTYIF